MKKKILILGSNGFIGQNIIKLFFNEKLLKKYILFSTTRLELDLLQKEKLQSYFEEINPNIVINAAGLVGSSLLNNTINEYQLFTNNITMQTNVLECCKMFKVEKIIFFSTYRIFGENIEEFYNESNIHSSYDINNNSGYLLSKKMLHLQLNLFQKHNPFTKYVCLILPNLYGKFDLFKENGRIVPSLIKKIDLAKQMNTELVIDSNSLNQVNLIYVEDIFFILEKCIQDDFIGENIIIFNKKGIFTLEELAFVLKEKMDFKQTILFNSSKLKESNNNNIMKPNLSKFESFFPGFIFSNHETNLHETIDYYFKIKTGIS
jgi:GDP-L-fucose synthase